MPKVAIDGNNVLLVVPARGGSKSIPHKNLKKVGGYSLVARAAMVAASLDWVDSAIVSTEDNEIAEEAKRYHLDVPFLRPLELAGDSSTSVDMWKHAWLASEAEYNMTFDISVLLEPTSPLRTSQDVTNTVRLLLDGEYQAAATVSKTPAHFTPEKTLTINTDGAINLYINDGSDYSLRQKIPSYYHRNGICYASRRESLIKRGNIIENHCAALIIDRPVVNIDEPYELELANWLESRPIVS
ncbi:CMP-N-acetylneuraminic acid synthetase [Solemya velum gill symbiont]|uniref:CMP-N-acetylneuraminic acid synthetase n=1 Tax=Solemya velum gill symbiont TaxID=2340 RepID=A0A0B0HC00_SOVGS|nr:CMP-N-acetylneuraminic acid synthetase [Solemya velum gill symbiont]